MAELSHPVPAEPDPWQLHAEMCRLEAQLSHLVPGDVAPFEQALVEARRLGDDGLLARALCLTARYELFWGRLEAGVALVETAIEAFARLPEDALLRLVGPHSEAWRVAGNGWLKLGNIVKALPLFEQAIVIAQRGVDAGLTDEAGHSAIPSTSSLVRCLNNLAMALLSMREMAGAMEVLHRAIELVDAHPQTLDDIPDDVVYIVGNLVDILQQEARDRLAAGESAEAQLGQARALLETRASQILRMAVEGDGSKLSVLAERDFLEASSQNLLLEGKLDEALIQFRRLADSSGEDRWRGAIGERGLAETLLALGRPAEALVHARLALAAYDQNEEIVDRANVLQAMSRIHRALGQDREALLTLEEHHRLRGRVDALAARQYAGQMGARIGLERARAEAEAQRCIASELQALNAKLIDQAAALEMQAQALSLARTAAEEASRAKSAFLANMSHELRTPLNAILGFAEMMRDGYAGPPGPAWSGYAGMVHEAGSHLLSVIGEILDLSKIEAGRVVLTIEPVDLAELFKACRELTGPMVERGGSTLSVACDPSLAAIPGDPIRLKQILLNLLSNAAKFTPQGGGITLSAEPGPPGFVDIRVADTGVGMNAVEVELALEVFGQIETSVARKSQGSGLGLPIAVGLTELHGGVLSIQSCKGAGTTVTVRLPA
ncbi:MAG: Sensor protein [Rhodospirillales bacterium]|nr:Sensor protein [Rhodospirillales bacterium]